jgi:DNA/RNA endonuclease YhcR with UshA esterase domain
MDFEKDFLKIVCLLSSLLGLTLIYYAAVNMQPREVSISDINTELVGMSATTRGNITKVRFHQEGHVFLTISDGKNQIQVPLFASFLLASGLDIGKLKVGNSILVSGAVDVYKNQLQIVPRKATDIKFLGG